MHDMNEPVQVLLTDLGQEELRAAHAQKAAEGRGDLVLSAIATLEARLGANLLNPDERLFDAAESGLPVVHAFVAPLLVQYAVDEQRRIVYLHRVRVVPWRP